MVPHQATTQLATEAACPEEDLATTSPHLASSPTPFRGGCSTMDLSTRDREDSSSLTSRYGPFSKSLLWEGLGLTIERLGLPSLFSRSQYSQCSCALSAVLPPHSLH